MIYEYIRKTTIRGSKIRKLLKILKVYESLAVENTEEIFSSLYSNDNSTSFSIEIANLSLRDSTRNTRQFIKEIFERESYKKSDFKKKAFSGAKMISVLSYIDFQIKSAENNLYTLNEDQSMNLQKEEMKSFTVYWKQQIISLNLIKRLIFSQYVTVQEEEDRALYNWLSDIEDDE